MITEDNRLRIIKTVATLRNFTAAAKELGITQPAVSQCIAEMEKALDIKLFDRSRIGVFPTAECEKFLTHAENILSEYKKIELDFKKKDSLLIKNVLHNSVKTNILIEKNRFKAIGVPDDTPCDECIEADGLAILPSFFNTHTHAAMSLLRGYADDMELQKWLTGYIWPFEDKLGAEDIRRGSEIAIREMAATGTTCFNDMYFEIEQTIAEIARSGMRGAIGITAMEYHSEAVTEAKRAFVRNFTDPTGGRIQLLMAPHAIYTVGEEKLKESAAFARDNGLKIHIHVSETLKEVEDCLQKHGKRPVEYLDSIGFLGSDVIAAHCVHVNEREWDILARRGVSIAHCPCSNMKLASGRFPYELAIKSGCRITIGTDGMSSNNNLDMREEMKFAALLAKVNGDPVLLNAPQVLSWASVNGAEALGIDAGVIAEGKLADCILVDLSNPKMQPCHNLISNWVYSADSSCVAKVICDGRVIYEK